MKDFTPTAETVSLHGLGFIQVALGGNQRLHVWHPELPRRKCFEHSAIHNHRFSFTSRVLKGRQINRLWEIELVKPDMGTHEVISHNGPRSDKGGRLSYPVAGCDVYEGAFGSFDPGDEYEMPAYAYHDTPNSGIVVTLMTKRSEGGIHANSIIERGIEFDQSFDRFQLSPGQLLTYVNEALLF